MISCVIAEVCIGRAAFLPALACHVRKAVAPEGKLTDPPCFELEDAHTGMFFMMLHICCSLTQRHECICSVKAGALV